MAGQDYGSGVAPFKRAIISAVLSDATPTTPKTLTLTDTDGQIFVNYAERTSASYKPNGRRPTGGPIVAEMDDQEISLTLKFGYKSLLGSTTHTPIEFMRGETVNSIALVGTGAAGKFLFQLAVTYDNSAESQGGASQTATYAYCELVSAQEEDVDGFRYLTATIRVHENAPTFA